MRGLSVSHAVSFAHAVEAAVGQEGAVPDRARALRTVWLELERLYNHFGDLGNLCSGMTFAVGTSLGAQMKETCQRLNERLAGNRFLRGTVTPGGVRRDLDDAGIADLRETLERLAIDLQGFEALLLGNDIAVERMTATGILSREAAVALEAVGVAARASGVDIDSRRDHPHAFYREVAGSLQVPVRTAGDVHERALVRMDEALVSLALIRATLAILPEGPVHVALDFSVGGIGFGATESPRGENVHLVRLGHGGNVERLRVRSASFPNWPIVVASVPGNMVPDFPLINKSFELCYACLDR